MAQLSFHQNIPYLPTALWTISHMTLSFVPIYPSDSISFKTLNFAVSNNATANIIYTFSFGLYSLNVSTLSLANSISRAYAPGGVHQTAGEYVSMTATSATQNITPGNWWFGMLISTSGNANCSLFAGSKINPNNAFPNSFIGGRMSVSTGALPSSYATSDLDITGNDAMMVPYIIISG